MKKCPFCAEDIQDAAIVCKHCGRDLPTVREEAPRVAVVSTPPPKPGVVARLFKLMIYGILLVGAAAVLVALFSGGPSSSRGTTSKTLDVGVGWSDVALQVTNKTAPAGTPVTIYINGQPPFAYRADTTLPEPGESVSVALRQFVTRDGDRFNPLEKAVTEAWVGGGGYDYEKFGRR